MVNVCLTALSKVMEINFEQLSYALNVPSVVQQHALRRLSPLSAWLELASAPVVCRCCPGPSGQGRPMPLTVEALLAAAAALKTQGKH